MMYDLNQKKKVTQNNPVVWFFSPHIVIWENLIKTIITKSYQGEPRIWRAGS